MTDTSAPAAFPSAPPPAAVPGLRRVVLGVQYDGSQWQGWQTQPHRKTVQDQLEAALQRFTTQPIATTCAGRTDSGVHALEQVVHFDTPISRDVFSWVRGTNAFLPPTIAVRWACELPYVDDAAIASSMTVGEQAAEVHGADRAQALTQFGFHARFSAVARTYHYVLYNHPVRSPLLAGKAGWTFRPLDADRMHRAAQHLIGEHDFTSFRAVGCQAKSPVRKMDSITVRRHGDMIVFTLKANAFLHHMVRNIVGSLIVVGNGNHGPEWIAELLSARDRSRAAPTFMPDGLYLARVDYPDAWALPQENRSWPWL
ncbi:tRNA pseudouridine(38-40) synthase TruA [Herbaspirillum sp. LeCh32-8]|uniref:tRNA pseudouridine synthase A n=1 Tax=Herbaspirillum sp. LeCh32-8 TaxID=2821356 RepID=UPI001AE78315|nr:tRNA pseudouridine synthase A [Herbaspirillum sp. LeCh32-8]MBP0599314.1 tRNA pseudouridine(38-40) synthase TruA [Herbaspirillum sp. LeCh32-8]